MNLIYLRQSTTDERLGYSFILIKYATALTLTGLLFWELCMGDKIDTIWQAFTRRLGHAHQAWFWIVVLAMPLNWLCETLKWHYLLNRFAQTTFKQSWRGVMLGVAFGLFTPNRIGEWGGRLLFVPASQRWRALTANTVGMISQSIVIFAFGAMGLLWIAFFRLQLPDFYLYGAVILVASGILFLLWAYFNIRLLLPFFRKTPILKHIRSLLSNALLLKQFSNKDLCIVMGWAILRYLIYAGQYFCLIHFFGINTGFWGGLAGIFTLFLLQTGLPLPPLMGLLARGSLAIQIWSLFGANDIASVASTSSLWIINLILPALVGTFFLIYVKMPKTYSHEQK